MGGYFDRVAEIIDNFQHEKKGSKEIFSSTVSVAYGTLSLCCKEVIQSMAGWYTKVMQTVGREDPAPVDPLPLHCHESFVFVEFKGEMHIWAKLHGGSCE